ncbi:MAG: nucleotide exchange factor GrpE [Promethearchaeota archaeon]|nr:MAG: nucleotide exchange factor GrpE [Candidatus Lokiarchaeota archaeon]
MIFGNQINTKMNMNKNMSSSQAQKGRISLEELRTLREKAEKAQELKQENEDLKKKKAELEQDVMELQEKNEKYLDRLQHLQADYENYKKRMDRANREYKDYATEGILRKLVSHFDDLKRTEKVVDSIDADEHIEKGFKMILKNFEKLLKEEGIEPIECEGEKFDPYKHEVMLVKDDKSVPENTVIEELEKGYIFKNKVLRPAKVMVSK